MNDLIKCSLLVPFLFVSSFGMQRDGVYKKRASELQSTDIKIAISAAHAVYEDGEKALNFLCSLKGNHKRYFGVLGDPKSGSYTLEEDEKTVTQEVVALYLIQGIYEKNLDFGSSLILFQRTGDKIIKKNSKGNIQLAWKAVERWMHNVRKEGLIEVQKKRIRPLGEHLSF